MTKEMLSELAKELKRKNKILLICFIVSVLLLIGMTAFAFSEFHIVYEKTTTYTAEQNAETQGDNSEIQQTIDTSEDGSSVYIIAGAIVLGLLILTAGVIIYGKSASKNNNKEKSTSTYHKDLAVQQEEKKIDNGKTDED